MGNKVLENERKILSNLERLNKKNEFFKDKSEEYRLELLTEFAIDIYNRDQSRFDKDKLKYILSQVDDEYSYYILYKALKNEIKILNETSDLIRENKDLLSEQYEANKTINQLVEDVIKDMNLIKQENIFKSDGSVSFIKKDSPLISDGKINKVYLFQSDFTADRIEFLFNKNIKTEFKGKFLIQGQKYFYSDNLVELKKNGIDKIKIIEVNDYGNAR